MEAKSVKQSVIDSYGKLASTRKHPLLSKFFACCPIGDTAHQIAEKNGYSKETLSEVPADSNLGVGCGNPSALNSIQEGETVIDLGSGAGFDAFIVSKIVGNTGKVVGIDLSDDMIELAIRNAKKGKYKNVNFVKGDIEDLPLADNIADHIISNCVINLSLNKAEVFKEAIRVLKPGGKLAISDIVLEKELPDYIVDSLAGHIACVSGAEKLDKYLGYISEAGFSDIEVKSKKEFPLEFLLTDPHLKKLAKEMNFDIESAEAKDVASRVKSISLVATK